MESVNSCTRKIIFVFFVTLAVAGFIGMASPVSAATFTNPLNNSSPDPFIFYYNGYYYMAATTWGSTAGTGLTMRKAATIAALKTAPQVRIWYDATSSRCCNMWAPEFYLLNGKWYGYYTAGPATCCDGQRLHVIQSSGTDPMGTYTYKGQLADTTGGWMIDGSILQLNSKLYLLFSAWSGSNQNVYIVGMSNPYTVSGTRVLISTPTYSWEKQGGNVNEGPVAIQHSGKTYVTYSASSCANTNYALGMLTLTGGNPLSASSWTKKSTAVFSKGNGVYGPGHNNFFTSPDGTETWMIYHGNDSSSDGCDMFRQPHIKKIGWNSDGSPSLGSPINASNSVTVPAGDAGTGALTQYKIVNRASGKVLDVASCNPADGTNIQQYSWLDNNCQRWTKQTTDSGYVTIVNVGTGKVLDVANCSTSNGGNVQLWSYLKNNCQQWKLVTTTSPYVKIVNRNSGKVLEVANCSTSNGGNVQQYGALGNTCQEWQLVAP